MLKPKAPKPMRRGSVSCRQSVVLPRLPRLEGLPLEFPEMEAIPEEPRVLYRTNKVDSISQYGGKITNFGLVHGEESV